MSAAAEVTPPGAAVVAAALRLALCMIGAERAGDQGNMALARVYENDAPDAGAYLIMTIEAAYPGFLDQETLPLPPVDGSRCWICGCTDDHACLGGCGWAGPDLCSRCTATAAEILRTGRQRLDGALPRA